MLAKENTPCRGELRPRKYPSFLQQTLRNAAQDEEMLCGNNPEAKWRRRACEAAYVHMNMVTHVNC